MSIDLWNLWDFWDSRYSREKRMVMNSVKREKKNKWSKQQKVIKLRSSFNHTSVWVFFCKFAAFFLDSFLKNISGGMLLKISHKGEANICIISKLILILHTSIRGVFITCQISKMKGFAKKFTSSKPLTISAKSSFADVWQGSQHASQLPRTCFFSLHNFWDPKKHEKYLRKILVSMLKLNS